MIMSNVIFFKGIFTIYRLIFYNIALSYLAVKNKATCRPRSISNQLYLVLHIWGKLLTFNCWRPGVFIFSRLRMVNLTDFLFSSLKKKNWGQHGCSLYGYIIYLGINLKLKWFDMLKIIHNKNKKNIYFGIILFILHKIIKS